MTEIWQQSVRPDPNLVQMLQEASQSQMCLAEMASYLQHPDPKMLEVFREAASMSDARFAQTFAQMQSIGSAFKMVWDPEILKQAAAASEMQRRAAFAMMDAMRPHLETLMRERDRMAEVMKPYFETTMRARDRSVENHGSPAVPRSEPEDTESKRAQKDEDDKRIPS